MISQKNTIDPKITLFGLNFDVKLVKIEDCDSELPLFIQLSYLYFKGSKQEREKVFEGCKKSLKPFLFYNAPQLLKNKSQLYKKLKKISKIKKQGSELADAYIDILDSTKNDQVKESSRKNLAVFSKYPRSFLSILGRVFYYSAHDNYMKVEKLIHEFILLDDYQLIFDSPREYFTKAQVLATSSSLLGAIERIDGSGFHNLTLLKIFKYKLGKVLWNYPEVSEKIKQTWSLSEIRENIKGVHYGLRYPNIWSPQLYRRTTFKEWTDYLRASYHPININQYPNVYMKLLTSWYPENDTIRKLLIEKMIELSKSKKNHDRDLFFRALEVPFFKQALSANHTSLKRPLPVLKREFYREMLQRGEAIEYSLYNLARLGDSDPELIYWVLIKPEL